MDSPPLPLAPSSEASDVSSSIYEAGSTGSWGWGSEASDEDSDEVKLDPLADDMSLAGTISDDMCADKEFWEEDNAAVEWLARYPGGTPALYPQLFVIMPNQETVLPPPCYPKNGLLLDLPPEIRNRIYRYYFDRDKEVNRSVENNAPFRDREGLEMQSICLETENVQLKFWLSTALLQTSRQVRFEAMSIFFGARVFTVKWLPVLPRFVEFLGKEGCAMVRYLDIWDTFNLQEDDNAKYQDFIACIMHFSVLHHFRIVLSWGVRRFRLWSDRNYSWFDHNEWKDNVTLENEAIPKIRSEGIEKHWPESEVLKNLKAQKVTFAVDTNKYLEFDRSQGAYPEISQSMRSHAAHAQLAPPLANFGISPMLPQAFEVSEAVEIQPRSIALTPDAEFDDESPKNVAWQETDALTNKIIPLYNFIQEHVRDGLLLRIVRSSIWADRFIAFPTARKSTGSIVRDCAICYLSQRHCGYHAMPDQPPFDPRWLIGGDDEDDNGKDDLEALHRRFEDMSYGDMRKTSSCMVKWMNRIDLTKLSNIAAIFDYLGWPETQRLERISRLDAAVKTGWTGKRVDKDEVPPWVSLYREVYCRCAKKYPLRREGCYV